MGYCVEIFREADKRYLLFVWPDVSVMERESRSLVCSRYGQTIREAAKSAVEYLKSIKQ
jgi:hypothetical protein